MIKMEHPVLPKKVEDPPVQLWSLKKDEHVSLLTPDAQSPRTSRLRAHCLHCVRGLQGKTFWFNVGTETTQREKPILKRGGILADEMGKQNSLQPIPGSY